jgi:hypothetical protein
VEIDWSQCQRIGQMIAICKDCTKTLEIQLIAFKTTKTNSVGTNVVSYQKEEK